MSEDADRRMILERLAVSRETAARLDAYVEALRRWQAVKNLVAPSTLPGVWSRHVFDSAQLLPLTEGAEALVDMGSGAGFPGMVLAILAAERGGLPTHLVESNSRKAAFLSEVARRTGAAVTVHPARIEAVLPRLALERAVVTARALAPLDTLLGLAAPLLTKGGRGLFPKGRDAARELTDSRQSWRIDAELIPSLTDPDASIVHVRTAQRIEGQPGDAV